MQTSIEKFPHRMVGLLREFSAPLILLLVCGGVFWLVAGRYNQLEERSANQALIAIFCLPCVLGLLLSWLLKEHRLLKPVTTIVTLSVLFNCFLWFYYVEFRRVGTVEPVWSKLAFNASLVIVGLALFMTWLLLNRHSHDSLKDLSHSLKERRFATVLMFLVLFSLATFFIAFALAFDDLRHRSWAASGSAAGLFGLDYPAYLVQAADEEPRVKPKGNESEEESSPIPAATTSSGEWIFYFAETGAELLWNDFYNEASDPHLQDLPEDRKGEAYNARNLHQLATFLDNLGKGERVHVLIVGHANPLPVAREKNTFSSNHELSKARAEMVMVTLIQRLKEQGCSHFHRIEWLPVAFSNVTGNLRDRRAQPEAIAEVLVVPSESESESDIAPPSGPWRQLTLLDYVYFAAYTITTTGYGDIVPISPFAKMVCSFANLFEVIFMVIFFNVLISFLNDGSGPGGSRNIQRSGPEETT